MVFQLPITDFPDNDQRAEMSSHDLVKLGYLHSRHLRWSGGGVRGRSTEWQFPLQHLSARELAPRLAALGFGAIFLDTKGYSPDDARSKIDGFTRLLGAPVASEDGRVLTWDLAPARRGLPAGRNSAAVRRLARRTLTLPRLYSRTDVEPLVARGAAAPACRHATLLLVNPRPRPAAAHLVVRVDGRRAVPTATVRINGRWQPLGLGVPNPFRFELRPGTTTVPIRLDIPNVQCDNVEHSSLPTVSATLTP
jgi:hypothetical protein